MTPPTGKKFFGMRFTIVEEKSTVSFNGPGHGLKVFAAACSSGATDVRSLLDLASPLDEHLIAFVRNGLAVFDEHVVLEHADRRTLDQQDWRADSNLPIRVCDCETRHLSLQPSRFGLVIFNLSARRIVQVQNTYGALLREDRGRVRLNGRPTNRYYSYRLPLDWALVP